MNIGQRLCVVVWGLVKTAIVLLAMVGLVSVYYLYPLIGSVASQAPASSAVTVSGELPAEFTGELVELDADGKVSLQLVAQVMQMMSGKIAKSELFIPVGDPEQQYLLAVWLEGEEKPYGFRINQDKLAVKVYRAKPAQLAYR